MRRELYEQLEGEALVKALYAESETDQLTGVLTFHAFRELAEEILAARKVDLDTVAILFFNIENFKSFNENHGFEQGNIFLKHLANLITKTFESRIVCRESGDHFVVMVYEEEVQPGLAEIYEGLPLVFLDAPVMMKAGVYPMRMGNVDITTAIDRAKTAADSILKQSEQHWRIYDEELRSLENRRKYIIENLDKALSEGWIKPYYQPVMRTMTGRICGVEALARWEDPVYGMLAPDAFIKTLEEYHLIHKLDLYMLDRICMDFDLLRSQGKTLVPISFNVSRLDFSLCDIHRSMIEALTANEIPRDMIHVEITETALGESGDQIEKEIMRFHEEGIEVWMDDFGSGYSSLNTLQNYDFDTLKIDMMFLRKANDKFFRIIPSVVSMAKDMGIRTLAEGVETPDQVEFLKRIGCEKIQGYFVSKPQELEKLLEDLNARGFSWENGAIRNYYEDIGRVNFLSARPMDFDLKPGELNLEDSIPLAIVNYTGDQFQYIYKNEKYTEVLRSVGLTETGDESVIENASPSLKQEFRDALRRQHGKGTTGSYDFVVRGNFMRMRARILSESSIGEALLVSLINLSGDIEYNRTQELNATLRDLYNVYEVVNILYPRTDTINHLYEKSVYGDTYVSLPYREGIYDFAMKEIHQEDRQKYLEFLSAETLEERIPEHSAGTLSDFFRFLRPDGGYQWKQVILNRNSGGGDNPAFLCCIRGADELRTVLNRQGENAVGNDHANDYSEVGKDVLWDNLMQNAQVGIFWKDANRRFLGANQMFLDYYGFQSLDEILGKNDEDMGWHVDPGPYREDEIHVIEDGAAVKDVPGKCIVHRQNRDIAASKMPIYDQGQVKGLLGYFKDVTAERMARGQIEAMANRDAVTGVLNMSGLKNACLQYIKGYDKYDRDFAYAIIDLQNFKRFNDEYGHSFGDHVLKNVAERIVNVVGGDSVVAHLGSDQFVVVRQYRNQQEIYDQLQRILDGIKAIRKIDDLPCTLYCYAGIAFYSETEDLEKLRDLAEMRVAVEKDEKDSNNVQPTANHHPKEENHFTSRSIMQLMRHYLRVFDTVRLVEPETNESRILDAEGRFFEEPGCCHDLLHKDSRCANCSSMRAIRTKQTQTKYERLGNETLYVISQYVEVNGKPFALELIRKMEPISFDEDDK